MIRRIGCIEVPVSNMEKAAAFYENVLGLKKVYEHPVWTSFDVGGISFALAASGTKGEKGERECRSCSLCVLRYVSVSTQRDVGRPTAMAALHFEVENLDEIYAKLKEQGVKFIAEPKVQGWGGKTAVMLDLDNNIIVLSEISK
ncbi:MAG: VOC family protein [Candidatus Bathyarchaeales archaeon]